MLSSHPVLEMRRLLSKLGRNLRKSEITDRRWQYSHIDTLVEQMAPLWAECGIDTPGLYIGRDTDPEYRVPLDVTFKSIEYRDPDGIEMVSIFLEAAPKQGGTKCVATVGELADVVTAVDEWFDFFDEKANEIESTPSSAPGNGESSLTQAETPEQPSSPETLFLETPPKEGGMESVATVGELAAVVPVVERWIRWIEARNPKEQADELPQISAVPVAPIAKQLDSDAIDKMPKAWQLAYLALNDAEKDNGRTLKDAEAWDLLASKTTELDWPYKLPSKRTFADYLNRARRHLGEQKNRPRGGRAAESRSVVKASSI